MKYLSQILIIIVFSFLGELLHWLIPFPIPASIYGLTLLFVSLMLKIVKIEQVKEVSLFLIALMPVMFLPPAVGLIDLWDSLRDTWIPFAVITVVTTLIVMAAAGITTQWVIRHRKEDNR